MTKDKQPNGLQTPSTWELLEQARARNTGKRDWQLWKSFETGEVAGLFKQANEQPGDGKRGQPPRVEMLDINFAGDLNIVYRVQMPVPRAPVGGELRLGTSAVFHLTYQEQWRREAPDGWAPLGLFDPSDPFHPNMNMLSPSLRGAICLGELTAGVAPKELVLLGYYALALQNFELDERDPNGVLNMEACEFYRNHQEYLPLTHAGFADPWEPPAVETETGTIAV